MINSSSDNVKKLNSIGGHHTLEDFAIANAEWVKPTSLIYKGIKVHWRGHYNL